MVTTEGMGVMVTTGEGVVMVTTIIWRGGVVMVTTGEGRGYF